MEKTGVTSRNFYLDNTKFFLITMVIWGHVLSNLCEGELCHGVDSFIYAFHMPLFIFISGYFTKVQDSKKFWKATSRLFETLIIFDVIHVIIRIAAGKIVVGEETFWTAFYSPQWSLWYLLSLISWRIMIYYVAKKIKITPSLTLIILSIVLGLLAGFVPVSRELGFQRTFFFLPFFTLGYVCKHIKFDFGTLQKFPVFLATCILMVVLFSTLHFDFQFKSLLMGCHTYYKYDIPLVVSLAVRLAVYFGCFITSVCILRFIPKREIKWISNQGAQTLYYFLYHTIIIYLLMALSAHFKLPTTFLMSIIYTAIIVVAVWALQKVKMFRILPNIISFYRERI